MDGSKQAHVVRKPGNMVKVDLRSFALGRASIPPSEVRYELRPSFLRSLFLEPLRPHVNSIGMATLGEANWETTISTSHINVGASVSGLSEMRKMRVLQIISCSMNKKMNLEQFIPDDMRKKYAGFPDSIRACLYLHESLDFVFVFNGTTKEQPTDVYVNILPRPLEVNLLKNDECWVAIVDSLVKHLVRVLEARQHNLDQFRDVVVDLRARAQHLGIGN